MGKKYIGIDVLTAARQRIAWVFDNFPCIYLSFSGGKDSTVMLHLVMDEAIQRDRKVGLLFVDLEAQYRLTIDHVATCFEMYRDHIEPFWVTSPIALRNAVSMYQPKWMAWEPGKEKIWVRDKPAGSISDFTFSWDGMEFEEFVPKFGKWYAEDKLCACFVGIRADESLNRYRTVASGKKQTIGGQQWTTWCGETLYNAYPVYDWKTEDIWRYHARFPQKPYNKLYDRMHQAGLSVHQMRICQPYGDDQRRGLWLFHIIEPETWVKIISRVNGANSGALYVQETGNVMGNIKISKPDGHTWESFARLLLSSMPEKSKNHFENKIAVFLKWYADRGYPNGIPDEADFKDEASKKVPSWRRVCKALLRNDYWCKGLSFTQQKTTAYDQYLKVMKKRRRQWGLI